MKVTAFTSVYQMKAMLTCPTDTQTQTHTYYHTHQRQASPTHTHTHPPANTQMVCEKI